LWLLQQVAGIHHSHLLAVHLGVNTALKPFQMQVEQWHSCKTLAKQCASQQSMQESDDVRRQTDLIFW
jgi:hypothetical protein